MADEMHDQHRHGVVQADTLDGVLVSPSMLDHDCSGVGLLGSIKIERRVRKVLEGEDGSTQVCSTHAGTDVQHSTKPETGAVDAIYSGIYEESINARRNKRFPAHLSGRPWSNLCSDRSHPTCWQGRYACSSHTIYDRRL